MLNDANDAPVAMVMDAPMMEMMPSEAMQGVTADMVGMMPPEAMMGITADMVQMVPPEATEGMSALGWLK